MSATNLEIILSSVSYIEERIRENITVSDIADDAGYSCYHFIRLFSGVTGFTPKEYMMKRRLTEAAKEILCSDRKIIDIAFEYDFQNHESFTRAFRREFGDNPAAFRKKRSFPDELFLEPLSPAALRTASDEIRPEEISLDRICLIGLIAPINGNFSAIGGMWSSLSRDIGIIRSRIVPERFYQLNCYDDSSDGGFQCMAAVASENLDDIPVRFIGKTLPAARYLRFIHKGPSARVVRTYDLIYTKFLPATSYKLTLPYNFEFYGDGFKGPYDPESVSEIYIPIG
jgi:AraC family transcriptional regulator